MVSGLARPIGLVAVAMAAVAALAVPLAPAQDADAAGSRYEVSNWTDPDGQAHRIRWNPCQTVTFAVNAQLAGGTQAARDAAVADVRAAFHRVSKRTGIPVSFAGRTSEIPNNGASESWSARQKAAEIVVAWVDQGRESTSSNLISKDSGGYPSGVGGWMMRAWTVADGSWRAAIGRGFVVINADHNNLYKSGFGSGTTRGALLLHEIGHAMGLGHVGTTRELMYPTMLKREHSNYKDGDQTGLSKVGKRLGCVAGANDAWPQI